MADVQTQSLPQPTTPATEPVELDLSKENVNEENDVAKKEKLVAKLKRFLKQFMGQKKKTDQVQEEREEREEHEEE